MTPYPKPKPRRREKKRLQRKAPLKSSMRQLSKRRKKLVSKYLHPARRKGAASPTYTVQSFWWALRAAEARASVPHKDRRGAHGLRRKLAGDLAAVASDGDAMRAIGDRDPRMAERYIKTRGGRVAETLNRLDEGVA